MAGEGRGRRRKGVRRFPAKLSSHTQKKISKSHRRTHTAADSADGAVRPGLNEG